ncbi:MAG: sodium:calcium antiporter [Methylobacterium sp.]|nr:MAG: sodium:calcium antiporter [Methylobacterium sp.]
MGPAARWYAGLARALLIWVLLLVPDAAIPADARRMPPPLHRAAEIEALVNRAADVLESEGARAFDAFRRRGGVWRYGDVYLFVVDLRGIVLFNAAHPNREGHDLLHERDADGKQFHQDFIDAVTRFGSGWVDYMFPKPGQAAPSVKWSYVCATRVAGVEALVGAGVYVE